MCQLTAINSHSVMASCTGYGALATERPNGHGEISRRILFPTSNCQSVKKKKEEEEEERERERENGT